MSNLLDRLRGVLEDARPGLQAGRGAVAAVGAAGIGSAILFEISAGFGLPSWLDLAVCVAFTLGSMVLFGKLGQLLLRLVRRQPSFLPGFVVGGALAFSVVFFASPAPTLLGFIVVLPQALLGAALGTILLRPPSGAGTRRKGLAAGMLVVAVAADVAIVAHVRSAGSDSYLGAADQPDQGVRMDPLATDPGKRGPHTVSSLTYGSGTDRRRPEYGSKAAIKTPSVDGTKLLFDVPALVGFSGGYRKWYWGFDMSSLPLNGRVWLPSGDGPFPLVLVVHGNALMTVPSDRGYAYLGEHLASQGFIVVSVDETFLNLGITGDTAGEAAARGWMLLEHLRLWRSWNEERDNPFFGKVDLSKIALVGHSRGGEAVATAALLNTMAFWPDDATLRFDYGFSIRAVVAIAPVDFGYSPARMRKKLRDVDYLVIQGGHDCQNPVFAGSRQYNRTSFSPDGYHFKAELYVDRANHSRFNTEWGRQDYPVPIGWLMNGKPLLSTEEQLGLARTAISAFLRASLRGEREYLEMFRDTRAALSWLPRASFTNRFQDSTFRLVCNFDEDSDVTTMSVPGGRIEATDLAVWREQPIPFRMWTDRQDSSVTLGWNTKTAVYSLILPEAAAAEWKLDAGSLLQLSMCQSDEEPPANKGQTAAPGTGPMDFTVELTTDSGEVARLPFRRFGTLKPSRDAWFYKWRYLDSRMGRGIRELVLQTYTLPLRAFVEASQGFDPSRLSAIRLRFDRSERGVVILDDVGFAGTPPAAEIGGR